MAVLRAKMQEWIDNGAKHGWLVDPERQAVEIYRLGQASEVRVGIQISRVRGRWRALCWILPAFGIRWRTNRSFRVDAEIVEIRR